MGKGDRKTRRGKIFASTYGNVRPRVKRAKSVASVAKKSAPTTKPAAKKAAPAKKKAASATS